VLRDRRSKGEGKMDKEEDTINIDHRGRQN